ncbi:MAG: hypothetical protein AC479_04895 [miscellaneous Crenarchaeota group-6 archaeon AD8-1]|nr:MAG: hypothetical protein AC479_04895 [miscellaneous Crenarchaeota group-6 archaeon AD8-1]
MCLAIPALVVKIEGDTAQVDFGQGVLRHVNISLVDTRVGGYVLIHAGYAIQTINDNEALETIKLWKEILSKEIE